MRRTMIAVVLATGALALVAGCGGSDKSTASDETVAAETATETTSADASTDTGVATDTTAMSDTGSTSTEPDISSLSGKCKDLVGLSKDFSEAMGASAGGTGNADFSKASDAFDEFADQVPAEIRGDFRVLAAAFAKYADALQGVDLNAGEAPSAATLVKIQKALSSLDQKQVQAASQHIQSWVAANC